LCGAWGGFVWVLFCCFVFFLSFFFVCVVLFVCVFLMLLGVFFFCGKWAGRGAPRRGGVGERSAAVIVVNYFIQTSDRTRSPLNRPRPPISTTLNAAQSIAVRDRSLGIIGVTILANTSIRAI